MIIAILDLHPWITSCRVCRIVTARKYISTSTSNQLQLVNDQTTWRTHSIRLDSGLTYVLTTTSHTKTTTVTGITVIVLRQVLKLSRTVLFCGIKIISWEKNRRVNIILERSLYFYLNHPSNVNSVNSKPSGP